MALSDCEKCWNTPCTCGYEWSKYTDEHLIEHLNMIWKIIADRNNIKGIDKNDSKA